MNSSRNITVGVLTILVLGVTILALLGIWDIIAWNYVQKYFWKSVQSLVVILISAVAIYLVQQMFQRDQNKG